MNELHFRSKVDLWIGVPCTLILGVTLALALRTVAAEGRPAVDYLIPVALCGAAAWMCVTSSVVTDETIVVCRGPFRSSLPLRKIRMLRMTRNWVSSPSLSVARIELRTERTLWLMVSPADRAGFVRAIQERVPDVELEGFDDITRSLPTQS